MGRSGLDVLGTISEALRHRDLETFLAESDDAAVEAIAAAAVKIDSEEADIRSGCERFIERVGDQWPGRDLQPSRLGRGDESRISNKYRRPRSVLVIDRADDKIR